ncbi:MAG TPA: DUF72 domain-containing protein [Solirubrobacteraceae bacterium]
MTGTVVVGTSSWADPGFVADWYPKGMPARERLAFYAQRFEGVELNSSFYAVPGAATVARWVEVTPQRFTFDVKLHRLLSRHSAPLDSLPPDLRAGAQTTGRGRVVLTPALEAALADAIAEAIEPLEHAGRLSALLLQLSPSFAPKRNELSELDALIERLAPRRVAVELRHRGWVEGERAPETLAHLSDRGAAFVCVDAPHGDHLTLMPPVDAVTRDDLAYVRLHGRNAEGYLTGRTVAERFGWDYSDPELKGVRARVQGLAELAQDTRVMFNNNRGADAPTSARRMRELLGQDAGPPPDADGGQMGLFGTIR